MSKGFEPLYTKEEAAEILRVKPSTIYKLVESRRLAALRGRPLRIPESSIKEYIRKNTDRALV